MGQSESFIAHVGQIPVEVKLERLFHGQWHWSIRRYVPQVSHFDTNPLPFDTPKCSGRKVSARIDAIEAIERRVGKIDRVEPVPPPVPPPQIVFDDADL